MWLRNPVLPPSSNRRKRITRLPVRHQENQTATTSNQEFNDGENMEEMN